NHGSSGVSPATAAEASDFCARRDSHSTHATTSMGLLNFLFQGGTDDEELIEQVMFATSFEIDRLCPRGLNITEVSPEVWTTYPFDAQCLTEFFQRMNMHLRRYSDWEEMLYTTLYVIISLFALIGNGVVILAVIRKKEMRTNRNVLIVNLALSNLMLALTTIPFLWLPSIEFEFPYSTFFCKFANALPGSNIYCSTLTISVMAIDRYYSVKRMNVASTGRNECLRAVFISLAIWVLSFMLSLPLLLYYDTTMLYVFKDVIVYDADRNETRMRSYGWRQCRLSPGVRSDPNDASDVDSHARMIQLVVSLMQVLFLYVVPLLVLSIFNVKLTRFLRTNAKHLNRSKSTPRRESYALSSGTVVTSYDKDTSPPSRRCSALHWTDTTSPSERVSERRRSRTTLLLTAMAASYAALWFPFTLVSVLIDIDVLYIENGTEIIERIDQSCKLISILSICVNPFLYGFLNTNFKNEFCEIFNIWIRCQPKRPPSFRRANGAYSSVVITRNITPPIYEEPHAVMRFLRKSFVSCCPSKPRNSGMMGHDNGPSRSVRAESLDTTAFDIISSRKVTNGTTEKLLAIPN
ncbi:Protein NPR-8 b, partial [Aphelenchoides avenae]